MEELDITQSQLQSKLKALDEKYQKLVAVAQKQNMPVKVNTAYLQNKMLHEEHVKKLENARKAVEVVRKAKDT